MNQLIQFEESKIRIDYIDGLPFFNAVDICQILEIGNPSQAITRLDDDEVTLISNEGRHYNSVNESGLYSLILGSRKPNAKKFKKWVTSEVLPSIRSTGKYSIDQQPAFQIPQTLSEALQLAADQAKQLELAAPKVAFVDNLVERHNLMTATQVGSKHKISAVKLNKFLDELGGVYSKSVKRGRVFLQPFIDSGYGELKQTELGYAQPLFTPAGEVWVNEQLIKEGIV